ncbi:unnamed protein product [Brassica rapa subsp. trilocularis]
MGFLELVSIEGETSYNHLDLVSALILPLPPEAYLLKVLLLSITEESSVITLT